VRESSASHAKVSRYNGGYSSNEAISILLSPKKRKDPKDLLPPRPLALGNTAPITSRRSLIRLDRTRRIEACFPPDHSGGGKEHRAEGGRNGQASWGARSRDLERRNAYWRPSGTISRWCRHKSRHHVHVARPHSTPPINFLISPAGPPPLPESGRSADRSGGRSFGRPTRSPVARETGCSPFSGSSI